MADRDLHNIFYCTEFLQKNRNEFRFSEFKFNQKISDDELLKLNHIKKKIFRTKFTEHKNEFCYTNPKKKLFYPFSNISKGIISRTVAYMYMNYPEVPTDILDYDLMLKWNYENPITKDEIIRNEKIFSLQGNRNRFIDDFTQMYKRFSL
jgi:endonuclease I